LGDASEVSKKGQKTGKNYYFFIKNSARRKNSEFDADSESNDEVAQINEKSDGKMGNFLCFLVRAKIFALCIFSC
jgi:hypothetical protein